MGKEPKLSIVSTFCDRFNLYKPNFLCPWLSNYLTILQKEFANCLPIKISIRIKAQFLDCTTMSWNGVWNSCNQLLRLMLGQASFAPTFAIPCDKIFILFRPKWYKLFYKFPAFFFTSQFYVLLFITLCHVQSIFLPLLLPWDFPKCCKYLLGIPTFATKSVPVWGCHN